MRRFFPLKVKSKSIFSISIIPMILKFCNLINFEYRSINTKEKFFKMLRMQIKMFNFFNRINKKASRKLDAFKIIIIF